MYVHVVAVSTRESLLTTLALPKTVNAAHWLQLEKPNEVNKIMRAWLTQWYPPIATNSRSWQAVSESVNAIHSRDEL